MSKTLLNFKHLFYLIILFICNDALAQKNIKKQVKPGNSVNLLAQTPPLGYNSYDSYSVNMYEEVALKEIDAFIEKFSPYGYEYFVIDNGWFSSPPSIKYKDLLVPTTAGAGPNEVSVNEFGIVVPSQLFFPNGFKPLVDKLHAKGLKFGVHLMRGIPKIAVEKNLPIKGTKYTAKDIYTTNGDCTWCPFMHGVDMSKPGAQEFYNSVFKQFADWGIDFVKVDDVTHFPAEIEAYVEAIKRCGRPIVLSLSAGGDSNVKYLETYRKTNMVRNTKDIWDDQISIDRSFESMRKWQGLEQKGFWPDLDMIPFGELCILKRPEILKRPANKSEEAFSGKLYHWSKFNNTQKEVFITQRAISASPIMIGGSMINMDDYSFKLLTDPDMLSCVKNSVHGKLVHEQNKVELWSAPESNNNRNGFLEYANSSGWIAIFNRSENKETFSLDGQYLRFLPAGIYNLKDVWGKQSVAKYKKGDKLNLEIEAQGVVFMKYKSIKI